MALIDDLLAATSPAEILRHVARATWAKAHDHAECPDKRLPAPADLAAWLPEVGASVLANACAELTATCPPVRLGMVGTWIGHADWTWIAPGGELTATTEPLQFGLTLTLDVVGVHRLWCAIMDGPPWCAVMDRPRHPLVPLVEAWQRRPAPRQAFVPVNRASLPRFAKLGKAEAHLSDFPEHGVPPPDGQWLLPGLGDAGSGYASWLLWLFDQASKGKPDGGRGARWDLRLFVYALLHLDVADRDGEWHTIRLPTDTVTGWLHPNGWQNERRDWDKLPEALHGMRDRLSCVPVDGIGYVAMLFPSVIPAKRGDPLIEFTARVPRVAANGDRLNWPRLLAYGAKSDRLIRAYLSVAAWLGRSAKRGHPITRQIAAPVYGPDGKQVRRKGGAIIRSATELTDNPAARYAGPPLSDADLTRMIGFDPSNRRRRHVARAAFERLEEDGVIEIERSGNGSLLFGGPNW